MKCKLYNPFVVKPKTTPKTKTKNIVEGKVMIKAKKKKVDIIYARGFVKLSNNSHFYYIY